MPVGRPPGALAALAATIAVLVSAVPAGAAQPPAAGAPGDPGVWTPADKHGFGTAHDRRSRVWYTLRRRQLTELFYPDLGTPAVRELQFVVSGAGGRAQRDATVTGATEPAGDRSLAFRQVSRTATWRLTKTVSADPARASVLVDVRFESLTGRPQGLHVVLDPALSNDPDDDRGRAAGRRLVAWDRRAAVALDARPRLRGASSGYKGAASDPARALRADGALGERFDAREPGNVVMAARTGLDGVARQHLRLAVSFGEDPAAALQAVRRSLARDPIALRRAFDAQWAAYLRGLASPPAAAAAHRRLYDQSLMVLEASEDKTYRGAGIASPSMPWAWGLGTIEREGSAPYHLVWGRDLYQVATALIAAGDRAAARRALDFLLFRQQRADGSFPQNSQVTGAEKWDQLQLDQVAFPLVLAWQLDSSDARRWRRLRRAAEFLVRRGPRTPQERWENQSGWSPATIAAEIAGLVCASELARRAGDSAAAARYARVADAWAASVARWTVTRTGPLSDEPYYLRIVKDRAPNRGTTYSIGDSGPGAADQRAVVDPSFLELVRLGIKSAGDPVVRNTLAVIDATIKADTPHGPLWHRFTYDGYGETRGGGPWDLGEPDTFKTFGRVWPLFSGERGEYELLAGNRAAAEAHLSTMALTANGGLMLPEQVWDGRPPTGRGDAKAGEGTRSATPLAWTHAQFVRLAWSIEAGRPVELPSIVACRYLRTPPVAC
jgi:glucoamylase